MTHPLSGREILFTRQRHEAKKAGLHWDYRLVLGNKAYSWATKKDMPIPGAATILFEQPVHDREYALSEHVEIPDGEYGAGHTYLDFVRKAKVEPETEDDKLVISSGSDRFLLKKLDPVKYGEKAWLFKNLSQAYSEGPTSSFTHSGTNYLVDDAIKASKDSPTFNTPLSDLTWIMEHGTAESGRVEKADVKVPLLVTDYDGKKAVLDGFHRLHKAKNLGLNSVPTRHVDLSKIAPIIKQASDMNKYLERVVKTQLIK